MTPKIDQVKALFLEHDIKATLPRMVTYQALMSFEAHPVAEDIYQKIQKKHPGISLATVYKTLDMLVGKGLAKKVQSSEDKVRYDGRVDHHIHLYCLKSKEILDYDDHGLQEVITKYLNKHQIPEFQVNDVQISIYGEKTN